MKVNLSTSSRLVLNHRPLQFAGFLWSVAALLLVLAVTGDIEALKDSDFPLWLGQLLLFGVSCGMMAMAWFFFPFQRFLFDRVRGTFSHRSARPLSVQTFKIPLAQIGRAEVEIFEDFGSQTESGATERAVLVRRDGTIYPLETGYVSDPRQPVVDAINAWLEGKIETKAGIG
jgi:hypothetical protein